MAEVSNHTEGSAQPRTRWVAAMPAAFVVLWSTGFVGAKYGLPYAEPLTFLLWRFALVTALLLAFAALAGASITAGTLYQKRFSAATWTCAPAR